MECERLKKLIKNWYMQVQDESMAPARMVDFMNNHTLDCATCMADPIVELEIKRITEIVLPPAKIPKAVRKVKATEAQKEDNTTDDVETDEVETNEVETDEVETDEVEADEVEADEVEAENDIDEEDIDEDDVVLEPDDEDEI